MKHGTPQTTSGETATTPRMDELENVIAKGKLTFFEVGNALAEIMEEQLYKQRGFGSFAEYCEVKWGFKKSYAYQLVNAAALSKESPELSTIVENPAQAREIAKVAPEERAAVMAKAGKSPTAKAIRAAKVSLDEASQPTSSYEISPVSGNEKGATYEVLTESTQDAAGKTGPAASVDNQFRAALGLPTDSEIKSELQDCRDRLKLYEQHLLDADLTGEDLIVMSKEIFRLAERINRVGKSKCVEALK